MLRKVPAAPASLMICPLQERQVQPLLIKTYGSAALLHTTPVLYGADMTTIKNVIPTPASGSAYGEASWNEYMKIWLRKSSRCRIPLRRKPFARKPVCWQEQEDVLLSQNISTQMSFPMKCAADMETWTTEMMTMKMQKLQMTTKVTEMTEKILPIRKILLTRVILAAAIIQAA